MRRQTKTLIIQTICYSTAYHFQFLLPNHLLNHYSLFLMISFSYQLLSLTIEYHVQNSAFLTEKMIEKKKLLHEHFDITQESIQFSIIAGGQSKSIIHAMISGFGAFYLLSTNSDIHKDHLFGTHPYSILHCLNSAAYFLGDTIDMFRYVKPFDLADKVFICHHIAGFIAFTVPVYFNIGYYFTSMILMYEISTPFIGLRWWLIQLNYGSTNLFKVVEYSFIITFISIRIIWGILSLSTQVIRDLLPIALGTLEKQKFPLFRIGEENVVFGISILTLVMLVLINAINAYFLYNIVAMLFRKPKRVLKKVE